jgi:hypothetical protein
MPTVGSDSRPPGASTRRARSRLMPRCARIRAYAAPVRANTALPAQRSRPHDHRLALPSDAAVDLIGIDEPCELLDARDRRLR